MKFGPFEILRPLGRGGMAETFLAARPGPDGFSRHVCLKRVLAERAEEPDFVRSFQREARLAARLVHPHIAQVYEFGCEGETWWMALEHVPGGDLRALLRALGQPMPLDLGLVLAVDMLEALGYAHELGIVHRDVSPSNILLDLQGNFKLADFGIAKARHVDRAGETAYSTTTGTIKGKAAYMAPEQALGHEVDGRADLWSFGVVLYEAFARAKPFEGPTDLAIMMAASQGRRRALAELAPHVPPDVCAVVERLLQPSLSERFQTAGEVLDALTHRPAPVQGRRRLAEMLKAIGAAQAELHDAAPTTISEAPPAGVELVRDEAPAPKIVEPAPLPSRAAPQRGLGPRAALILGAALVAGALTALALVRFGPAEASSPAAPPEASRAPPPAASVPPTEITRTEPSLPELPGPDAAVARGVSIPEDLPHEPVPEAPPQRERGRERAASGAPGPERAPARAEAVPDGTLQVTVVPWGDVSIDGRPMGRSPVTTSLRPGTHRVEGRSESGSESREVRVVSGSRQEIEVDLTD